MRAFRRPALIFSAALLGAVALGFEPEIVGRTTVEAAGGRLTVGSARIPLWSAALAQADEIALENVTLVQGSSTYTAKRVVFSGVRSSRGEIDAILDRSAAEPLAVRLSRLNARQVSIPELLVDRQVGAVRQRSAYKNVTAEGIAGGRIASIVVDEGVIAAEMPKRMVSSHRRLTLSGLAAADLARIYFEKAGPQGAPLTRVYDAFTVEDIRHEDGDGTLLRIAKAGGRDVLMRPTDESWAGANSLISALAEMDQPSTAESSRLAAAMADMLGAFEIGSAEMHGIDMTGRSEKGEALSMKLGRVGYSGASGRPADLRLEGFELAAPDGSARFATLAFTGFSFEATRQGLRALKGRSLDDIDAATLRALIPTLGTMRFSGLDFDLPNAADGAQKPDRVRFGIKDVEFTADRPLNGVPTHLRVAVQNLAMPLPAASDEEGSKTLVALGYKNLDLSFAAGATWNEAGQEIALRDITVSGAEMFNVRASGTLGNVTKDVFNADTALATVAALGATAKTIDLTIENMGFFERYVAQEAKKLRRSPESLRREYGSAAAFAIPAMLGNSDQVKALGQAVARFVAKPARLRIEARARNASGLGVADVLNMASPADLLQQIDIRAATDERL